MLRKYLLLYAIKYRNDNENTLVKDIMLAILFVPTSYEYFDKNILINSSMYINYQDQ